jgi:hypothetical protein
LGIRTPCANLQARRYQPCTRRAAPGTNGRTIDDLAARVEGVMASEYLVKLAEGTRRGLRGGAERGLAAGGKPYGYRTEPVQRYAQGAPVPQLGYRMVVVPAEAEVVRRVNNYGLAFGRDRTEPSCGGGY